MKRVIISLVILGINTENGVFMQKVGFLKCTGTVHFPRALIRSGRVRSEVTN
jgi:hypothetical protein